MTENEALRLIEHIAFESNPDEESGPMIEIYKIAHAFSATCPHEDWKRDTEKLRAELDVNSSN